MAVFFRSENDEWEADREFLRSLKDASDTKLYSLTGLYRSVQHSWRLVAVQREMQRRASKGVDAELDLEWDEPMHVKPGTREIQKSALAIAALEQVQSKAGDLMLLVAAGEDVQEQFIELQSMVEQARSLAERAQES